MNNKTRGMAKAELSIPRQLRKSVCARARMRHGPSLPVSVCPRSIHHGAHTRRSLARTHGDALGARTRRRGEPQSERAREKESEFAASVLRSPLNPFTRARLFSTQMILPESQRASEPEAFVSSSMTKMIWLRAAGRKTAVARERERAFCL